MKIKKREKKPVKIIIIAVLAVFIWILGFYLYTTYKAIEIDNENYTVIRTRFHI